MRADAGLASGRDVTLVTRRVVRSARAMPSPAAGASGTHVRSVSLAKFESVNAKTRLGVERGAPNGHDKILELRAERHRDAAASDPNDHDALYGWALVLQEQAERAEAAGVDVSRRLAYLADACDKYARARAARPRFHAALYNHGIALGDRARATADPAAARALWLEACEKYRAAVECDASRAGAVQALNNWGLASRQIAALSPTAEEKNARLLASVGLFREALRRDPTFHRAAYNLGTVFYALSELAQRRARAVDDASTVEDAAAANAAVAAASGRGPRAVAVSAEELQTAAAMYICCARAAAPEPVYASSLRLVRHTLPLPALAAGSLLASPPRLAVATRGCWTRRWFVLDHEAFWTGEAWPEGGGPVDGGAMGAMGTWAEVPRPRATRTQLDAPETRGGAETSERESRGSRLPSLARTPPRAARRGGCTFAWIRSSACSRARTCRCRAGSGFTWDWTRGAACFWWLTRRRRGRRGWTRCGSRGRSRRGGGRRRFERSWHRTSPSRRNSRTTRAGTRDDSVRGEQKASERDTGVVRTLKVPNFVLSEWGRL